ncbi:MAG: hypothetical protein EPO28_14165 [Saprospiraceae bacterium]|nr:MAG: hypothetical protein EPO28_14165 [Saprospiraceae bacterium]
MIFAVSIFTYFSALGFLMSIIWSFKTEAAYNMLSMAAGLDLQQTSVSTLETGRAMKFLLIDFTSQMAGLNLFALLIIWTPFRHGELWAWMSLWFYPLMFAWHYLHYATKTKFSKVQIVYCVVSIAALLASYSQFN